MAANTKIILYRMRSQLGTVLSPFLGTGDADVQTNADSITAGTGFTDASLAGQAVAYAELLNPVVYDSGTGLYKRLNNAVLWQDPVLDPKTSRVHIAKPADESATAVHAAFTLGVAASTTAVHAAVTLTGAAQDVASAITNPAIPRHLTVTGNASGIAGAVVITGTNESDAVVGETLLLSGTATVEGAVYFKTVTNINVPAKTNASGDTVAVGTGAAGTLLAFTNPDVPRVVSITGSASGITGGVKVIGTDVNGTAISDTIASSGTSTVDGVKAFKTVTEVQFPAKTNSSGDTISIGISDKLGIGFALARNTVVKTYFGNVLEGTAPTVTVNSTDVSKNLILLNTDLDGASDVDFYLITG